MKHTRAVVFLWCGLLILKEVQEGGGMDQGEMGTKGKGKRGKSQFIPVTRLTTVCLSLSSPMLNLDYAAGKLFSLYLAVKIINYLKNLFIFLLY